MKSSLWILFVSFSLVPLHAQEVEELVTLTYQLDRSLAEARYDGGGGEPFGHSMQKDLTNSRLPWLQKQDGQEARKAFFVEQFGLSFPEGSSVDYNVTLNRLTMTNSPENHERLRAGLVLSGLLPSMIQLQFRILAFEADQIDRLERKHPHGIPDAELIEVWMNGDGETLASQSLKTINGVNAIVESVVEHTYPTEAGTVRIEEGVKEQFSYGALETRNIGVMLNVTPTLNHTGRINLVVMPEQTESQGSSNEENPELAPLTPLFQSLNLTTSVIMTPGVSLILGSSRSLDGEAALFLVGSVQLVGTDGDVIEMPHLHE